MILVSAEYLGSVSLGVLDGVEYSMGVFCGPQRSVNPYST